MESTTVQNRLFLYFLLFFFHDWCTLTVGQTRTWIALRLSIHKKRNARRPYTLSRHPFVSAFDCFLSLFGNVGASLSDKKRHRREAPMHDSSSSGPFSISPFFFLLYFVGCKATEYTIKKKATSNRCRNNSKLKVSPNNGTASTQTETKKTATKETRLGG
jgi:hypothetical protein